MPVRINTKKSIIAASLLVALSGCNNDDNKQQVEDIVEQAPNVLPTVGLNSDITVDEKSDVTLTSNATDTDGTITSYNWVQTAGTSVTLTNADTANLSFTAPDVKPSETLTFELTVQDNDGGSATGAVNVLVTHINAAPALSVSEQSVEEKQSITITAVAEDDGSIASYQWFQLSGTGVVLENANTAAMRFTAPSVTENEMLLFAVTVVDDEGESSSANVNVEVLQNAITLSISGVVTDSPIENANVTFTVGDNTLTTTADAQGNYTVEFNLDDDDSSSMVSIIAQGEGAQAQAKLSSILGTVERLDSLSGDDNTLTKDELFDVNVTNVTTANAALVQRENLGEAITDDTLLAALNLQVSQEEKFALATAIKVAIDKSGDNPSLGLPEGITDTLALALNTEAATQYVDAIKDTPAYTEAYDEIVNDPELVNSDISSAIKTFFISDYHNPLLAYPGSVVKISDDDSAHFIAYDTDVEATFSQDANEIVLSFADGEYVRSGLETIEMDGNTIQVNVEYQYQELRYLPLDEQQGVFTFQLTNLYSKHYPNGELSDESGLSDTARQVTAISIDNANEVALDDSETTYLSLPITSTLFTSEDPALQFFNWSADTFAFSPDGTGSSQYIDRRFTWLKQPSSFDQTIDELLVTFEDGTELAYLQLTDSQSVNLYAVSGASLDGETRSFKVDAGGAKTLDDAFDVASVPGIYSYAFDGSSINEFWWELWPNGRAYTISTNDRDGNGSLTVDEISVMYGNWRVSVDGELTISRLRFTDYRFPGCFNENPSCYLYNDRSWSLFAKEGEAYHITNRHEFDFYLADGSNGFDGEFDYLAMDNRRVSKQSTRPVSVDLPIHPDLPSQPPQQFIGLVAPSSYVGSTVYGVAQNLITSTEDATFTFTLAADGTYENASSARGVETGGYKVAQDQSIILSENEAGAPTSVGAFLFATSDVTIGAVGATPVLLFNTSSDAQAYETVLRDKLSEASFATLNDKQLVLVDVNEDSEWNTTFVSFSGSEATIFNDETFTSVVNSFSYTTNDDGSIDLGGRLYLSISNSAFSIFVSDEEDVDYIDINYLFEDVDTAKQFVKNANNLANGNLPHDAN
ncbi:hypothetical protein N9V74_02215 [Alteromonas sp.]|nr:hypothetical protein [Alteromonas sp.]